MADPWVALIRRACAYLANAEGRLPLAALAARVGGSRYHLQRNFKRLVGVTPREYGDACRVQKVKRVLRRGGCVTAAVFEAGYESSSRFYEGAVRKLGMTPSVYKKGGAGVVVRYAIVDSPLGRLLAGVTERGVCAVSMGDSDDELVRALEREYPSATIEPDRQALAPTMSEILDYLAGRRPRVDLPLDVRATAFQWQVWNALSDIPSGQTRSYTDVARSIGRPRAVRAVARACAANPVALAIPCHRVVPIGGGVGGYRWGAARKKALLAEERARG